MLEIINNNHKTDILSPLLAIALLSLTGCADPAHTGPAGQDPNAWKTRGCIDKTLQTCIDNIGASMAVIEEQITPPQAEWNKTDVNGNHVFTEKVGIPAYIPSPAQPVLFTAFQDQTGIVRSVDGYMEKDLFHAVSVEDFHNSGMFPLLSVILGAECPGLNEAELARLFYNDLKPKILTDSEIHRHTRTLDYDTYKQHTPDFPLCGHTVSFASKWGDDRKKASGDNFKGDYSQAMVIVK